MSRRQEFQQVLEWVRVTTGSSCLIIFGSLARNNALPGSDVDVVAVTPQASEFAYYPTAYDGVPIDLNLVSLNHLAERLRSNWYWRALLRSYQLYGECARTENLLKRNAALGQDSQERACMIEGWTAIARAFRARETSSTVEIIESATRWQAVVALMNGVLQLSGRVPHSYHNHSAQVHLCLGQSVLVQDYLAYLSAIAPKDTQIPEWLHQFAISLGSPGLSARLVATQDRVSWLARSGRATDASLYLLHALWALIVHAAAAASGRAIPSSHADYPDLVLEIDDVLSASRTSLFAHRACDLALASRLEKTLEDRLWQLAKV